VKNNRYIIFAIIVTILVIIVATFPFAWQNASDYKLVNNKLADTFKTMDELCNSGCTNFPKELVEKGLDKVYKQQCLEDCPHISAMKTSLEKTIVFNFKYRSELHKNVGFVYCLLGLSCLLKSN
jgi:hypothetical protein